MYYEYLEMSARVTQFYCIKSMLQPTKNNAQPSGMATRNAIR